MTLALVVIMGMAAFVIDVGNWYHTRRRLQGTADAAALAGAQRLPNSPSGAQTMALSYANQNGGGGSGAKIIGTSTVPSSGPISVRAGKTATSFLRPEAAPATLAPAARAECRARPPPG